ncbi:MAG: type II toxin-antitoxin system death-on-curing family toxin [Propionivibrio sp.]|uniref:type II toxin-antitoxin system death-on-curing family toxin n=1 Tax=Propionivibrio sp. TaxID=2212460 RepID=UPI001A589A95|nr:type II toxin-antitoxin system death-on-curing family toxin [Propionivibrio sp.]MBL8415036.1 type II toxin-antitoxin system death-on-curing family toxin [Propionivibrio sp.]
MNFRWINRQVLVLLHDESLAIHGGGAGLRDAGLFESALARPENLAAFGAPDVFECAAAYAFGLSRNHPFVDGNKRVAFLASGVFLRINGYRLNVSQADAAEAVISLAAGDLSESAYAAWLRAGCVELNSP